MASGLEALTIASRGRLEPRSCRLSCRRRSPADIDVSRVRRALRPSEFERSGCCDLKQESDALYSALFARGDASVLAGFAAIVVLCVGSPSNRPAAPLVCWPRSCWRSRRRRGTGALSGANDDLHLVGMLLIVAIVVELRIVFRLPTAGPGRFGVDFVSLASPTPAP